MRGSSAERGGWSAERIASHVVVFFRVLHSVLRIPHCPFALAVCFAAAFPALAQDKSVNEKRIEIEPAGMQPTIQTGRPIPTWWDVKVKGSALVEGRFEFVLKHEGQLLASLTTEELALTGPQQRIRVLLPPVSDPYGIDQLQVEATFRGKSLTENLGQHILRVVMVRSRTFMVLTSTSPLAAKRSVERDRVLKRLAFESMLTSEQENPVLTIYSPLEPDKLPAEPMAYCAYDGAVLFGDEFRAMKKPQLDALAAWVRAGGSLYVEPTGVLEPYHVEFLRGLTFSDPRGLVVQPDSHGRLIPGTIWEDERIVTVTSGMGRVVIRVDEDAAGASFDSAAWRAATAALWRLNSEQTSLVRKHGRIVDPCVLRDIRYWNRHARPGARVISGYHPRGYWEIEEDTNGDGQADERHGTADYEKSMNSVFWTSKLPTSTSELLDRLMPEGVRMVPLWLLGVILLGFVAVIGPVDYIGLGWLKARKYTWLLFPLATVTVTGLTVWVSNSYMSSAEARRGLVIRDVGEDGSIVRTNRFELLFIASSRPVTTEVRKGVFAPLGTGGSMDGKLYQQQLLQQRMYPVPGRPRGSFGWENTLTGAHSPPRIEGRIPTQFEVKQDLAKWTPQMNRMFWIPGSVDEQPVDWNAITDGQVTIASLDSHTPSGELLGRVRKQFGNQALVACLGPNGRWAYDRNAGWWAHPAQSENPHGHLDRWPNAYQDETNISPPVDVQQQGDLFRWLYQHSIASPRGLFALVSQIGPKGGPELDDLPVYDPTDSEHALLIVVVPVRDDIVVYRKRVRCGT